MDDEDLAEAEQAQRLQTADSFAGLGGTDQDAHRRVGLLDIFRPSEATMGVKLLQKMGWREGQGIGPRVRRALREENSGAPDGKAAEMHLLAPENTKIISFNKKRDHKGLGYDGEISLARPEMTSRSRGTSDGEDNEGSDVPTRSKSEKSAKSKVRGGFGMGVLNDTGSDEDDPYTMGPKIAYNRVIGGERKKSKMPKPGRQVAGLSNPLLEKSPVFSKVKQPMTGFRKCSDGRLPLEGFVLAIRPLKPQKTYASPKIPDGWNSKFAIADASSSVQNNYQSTADAAKASEMDPKSRAGLLGEQQLPGKSVFDFMSTSSRERLAQASGRSDLPAAGNESAPAAFRRSESEKNKDLRSLLPGLDRDTAMQALNHRSLPYAEDETKRRRYRQFLELNTGSRTELPERGKTEDGRDVSTDDYVKEMREFAHAAKVFRPMSGMMATRFAPSSSAVSESQGTTESASLLSKPAEKPADPAEEAAKLGMYGPMTRTVLEFYPTRLVCKRFNVKPPAHVAVDPGGADGTAANAAASEPVSKRDLDRMMQDAALSRSDVVAGSTGFVSGGTEGGNVAEDKSNPNEKASIESTHTTDGSATVDAERNAALERQRPGEELFRAIFGSDDEAE